MNANSASHARLRRSVPLLLAAVLIALAALMSAGDTAQAQSTTDYDTDGDNLIEVSNLEQLNAIRWDLDGDGSSSNAGYATAFPSAASGMGCAATCTGYELTADLDFNDAGSYASGSVNSSWITGSGWSPIGGIFVAEFNGNGHTISGLFINRSAPLNGLFADLGSTSARGLVRNVGLVDVNVTGGNHTGSLVGRFRGGSVQGVYATGSVSGAERVGGLVGSASGVFRLSWSSVAVTATSGHSGGLVGSSAGDVLASYATGSVTGTTDVGGLIGTQSGGFVRVSYATGAVSGTGSSVGGLIGYDDDDRGAITLTASYFDADTTGRVFGWGADDDGEGSGTSNNNVVDGTETNSLTGNTTSELQTPTGYTGIYADWDDHNVDGVSGNDAPWDFGTATDYPSLKVDVDGDGMATAAEFGEQHPPTDYDTDDDNLIEVSTLEQLNAMRWDTNGNGAADDTNDADDYAAAFPDAPSGMGCPAGCQGYELAADLDFDDAGSYASGETNDDWTTGTGWDPIGDNSSSAEFRTTFDGNGHTISNLFIDGGDDDVVGLFGRIGGQSTIRNVGLLDVDVTADNEVGGLVGRSYGYIRYSYVTGSVEGDDKIGGLVGRHRTSSSNTTDGIFASWSSADVTGEQDVGGLAGEFRQGNIVASYATGTVTADNNNDRRGGLVGRLERNGDIHSSYATGEVLPAGGSNAGGLVGAVNSPGDVEHSYYDTDTGRSSSARGTGKTTEELKSPTRYTGIYASWNTNVDGAGGNDNPWDFGRNYDYPTLRQTGGPQKGPGPVMGPSASRDSTDINVSFAAPSDLGDGSLTGYEYRFRDVEQTWPTWTAVDDTEFLASQTFASNTNYAFQIRALTDAAHGVGPISEIGPPDAPNAPRVRRASTTSVQARWNQPNTIGGAITDYDVRRRAVGTTAWTDHSFTGTGRETTIGSLTQDTTYQVQVRASNAMGTGGWSGSGEGTPSESALDFTGSDAFTVKEHHTGVIATVRAEDTDPEEANELGRCARSDQFRITGGADRGDFIINCFGGLSFNNFVPDYENPRDDGGDNEYNIEITVKTGSGDRVEEATGNFTVTVQDVNRPDAPANLRRTDRNTVYLAVEWDRPNHGGLQVDRYGVRYREVGQSRWRHGEQYNAQAPANPNFGIAGLRGGTRYEIQARARNPEGWGPWSASFQTSTGGEPSQAAPPRISNVTATGFEVRWSAPDSRSPITGYQLRYGEADPGGSYSVWTYQPTMTSVGIGGLERDTRYEVGVRARNASGWGNWSAWAEATTGDAGSTEPGGGTSPISGFTLLNSSDGSVIQALTEGATVAAGQGRLEIRADLADGRRVGSVRIELRGPMPAARTEHAAPYELFGGHSGAGLALAAGSYTLTATAYTGPSRTGQALPALSITFTVIEDAGAPTPAPPPPVEDDGGETPSAPRSLALTPGDRSIQASWDAPQNPGDPAAGYLLHYRRFGSSSWQEWIPQNDLSGTILYLTNDQEYEVRVRAYNSHGGSSSAWQRATPAAPESTDPPPSSFSPIAGFTLVDGDDGTVIQALTDGATLASGLGKLEIRADLASGESAGSVHIELSGPTSASRTENHAPYELFGGQDGAGQELSAGTYTLTATPYTDYGGSGTELTALTIIFTVQ